MNVSIKINDTKVYCGRSFESCSRPLRHDLVILGHLMQSSDVMTDSMVEDDLYDELNDELSKNHRQVSGTLSIDIWTEVRPQ